MSIYVYHYLVYLLCIIYNIYIYIHYSILYIYTTQSTNPESTQVVVRKKKKNSTYDPSPTACVAFFCTFSSKACDVCTKKKCGKSRKPKE